MMNDKELNIAIEAILWSMNSLLDDIPIAGDNMTSGSHITIHQQRYISERLDDLHELNVVFSKLVDARVQLSNEHLKQRTIIAST